MRTRRAAEQTFDDEIPERWTTDVFRERGYWPTPWRRYVLQMHNGSLCEMEIQAHYYGTPSLLLYSDHEYAAIFKMGGLLFVVFESGDTLFVARHGVSATQLALAINNQNYGPLLHHGVSSDDPRTTESYRYFILWQWEKHKLGRDRWAELRDRDGEVDPGWLRPHLLVDAGHIE